MDMLMITCCYGMMLPGACEPTGRQQKQNHQHQSVQHWILSWTATTVFILGATSTTATTSRQGKLGWALSERPNTLLLTLACTLGCVMVPGWTLGRHGEIVDIPLASLSPWKFCLPAVLWNMVHVRVSSLRGRASRSDPMNLGVLPVRASSL